MLGVVAELVGDFKAFREEGYDAALTFGDVAVDDEFAIMAEVVDGVELDMIVSAGDE